MKEQDLGDESCVKQAPLPGCGDRRVGGAGGRWFWGLVWISYAVLLLVILGTLMGVRGTAETHFSTEASQADWDAWRQAAEKQDGTHHPVRRRVPQSAEPPTLRLLRDHFGVCVGAAVTLTSALFWTVVFLGRGVFSGPSFAVDYQATSTPTVPP